DSISSNTIYRTGTTTTLIELCRSPPTVEVHTLTIWCLARICRSAEVAQSLIKQNLASILIKTCSATNAYLESPDDMNSVSESMIAPMALYALGNLIQSDGIADYMASVGLVPFIANHLSLATGSPNQEPDIEVVCSSIYTLARISRSIKLAKALARAGCIELLSHHLKTSTDPTVLHWSARAVGCLMRPNSGDMAKVLLDAGIPKGLARLPTVLALPEDSEYHHGTDALVEPLGSFGFAIQRFSCAEWGGGTRKALVEAGVVDSLLAALRAVRVDVGSGPHVELALAVSLLGDVGGTAIRKEIVNAGGIEILKGVSAGAGGGEVKKACEMAITSVTGNIFSRNAGGFSVLFCFRARSLFRG
ncbi:ARM repeat-containing protein, partial [Marasmius fiardii PR-910]